MFRKNYVPNLTIAKSSETGKWFAYVPGDSFTYRSFVERDDGYSIDWHGRATEYETIDKLMKAVYDYARILHTNAVHKYMTYSSPKVKL